MNLEPIRRLKRAGEMLGLSLGKLAVEELSPEQLELYSAAFYSLPALSQLLEAVTWQPISTAPRDGTTILIAGGTYYYDASMSSEPSKFTGVTEARWDGDGWNGGYGSEYDGEYWHEPTVWLRKPTPPEDK